MDAILEEEKLSVEQVSPLRLPVISQFYHTLHCNGCKREFKNKERVWRFSAMAPSYVLVGDCCIIKINEIIDFDPKGSKESSQLDWSWLWIRTLVLRRDSGKCRVNHPQDFYIKTTKDDWELLAVDVHHIIPKKDGGTNNFKNLITLCKGCHKATFPNGYGGIPRLQTRLDFMLDDFNQNKNSYVFASVTKQP